ncbi:MAG: FMN-binding protein [Microbacteriaceae bacterium]|nr:FMN-binding protein [Microbacteriaceae bacterium]
MRTRAALGGVFASIAVLTIGWQVGSSATPTTTSQPTASGSTDSSASTANSSTSSNDGTYTGDSVSTRFGDVQVQITVSGGALTDVTALQLTDHDGKSVQISNRAAPVLRSEVLQAGSANVNTVSGATYTSDAYLTSLQSALDQAGL